MDNFMKNVVSSEFIKRVENFEISYSRDVLITTLAYRDNEVLRAYISLHTELHFDNFRNSASSFHD